MSQVSEAICAARPVAGQAAPPAAEGEKGGSRRSSAEIAAAEVGSLAALAAGMLGQRAGLGVLEQAMRSALAAAGARLLEAVLAGGEDGYAARRLSA